LQDQDFAELRVGDVAGGEAAAALEVVVRGAGCVGVERDRAS
jgi:hypothetical protein